MTRLRLADDVRLMSELAGSALEVADRNGANTINVASDEPFIRSLDRNGFASLEPSAKETSE